MIENNPSQEGVLDYFSYVSFLGMTKGWLQNILFARLLFPRQEFLSDSPFLSQQDVGGRRNIKEQ